MYRYLAVFLAALLLAALPARAEKPSEGARPMPHTRQGVRACMSCHDPGRGPRPAPADHGGRSVGACGFCHPGEAPSATLTLQQSTNSCRGCHRNEKYSHVADIAKQTDIERQAHADKVFAHHTLACVTCHGGEPHDQMHAVTRKTVATACGKCHQDQLATHRGSIHGRSLEAGGKDAASCVDCHSTEATPHSIARVMSPKSPAYRSGIAATCARCHAKTELMGRYGVPTEVYKTYMSTFHGKANVLSPYEITQHPKATCVSCHGYHDILAAADPHSPVAPVNLANTCGSCHPGAGERFAAGWMGHKEATPQQFPVVYWAERFFFYLTATVLTFGFIFMVMLDLVSTLARRRTSRRVAS